VTSGLSAPGQRSQGLTIEISSLHSFLSAGVAYIVLPWSRLLTSAEPADHIEGTLYCLLCFGVTSKEFHVVNNAPCFQAFCDPFVVDDWFSESNRFEDLWCLLPALSCLLLDRCWGLSRDVILVGGIGLFGGLRRCGFCFTSGRLWKQRIMVAVSRVYFEVVQMVPRRPVR
jgi:hypothetical protein